MPDKVLSGADGVMKALEDIARKMGGGSVSVGFMNGATYPDGTPVAAVAFWNEYGAVVEVDAHETVIYRSVKANGDFNKGGKFVKKGKSNFASTHMVPAHTIRIPPRPFFRNMIAKESPGWPKLMAKLAKAYNYDAKKVLDLMGENIKDALVNSIRETTSPGNAKSTIAQKGFDKPLVGVDHQLTESITHKVES